MTNRELLEYAARAGEVEGKYYIAYGQREINEGIDIGGGRLWNPLTRNEDAFSLMVKCQMDIHQHSKQMFASVLNQSKASVHMAEPDADREKYARSLITKCAALIGGIDPSVFNNWCPTRK